jgi:hypothetical protein
MLKPRPDAILVRHDERCPACRYSYDVWTWHTAGNWVAYCAEARCGAFRDNLDIARYGADLGLPTDTRTGRASSRFDQSRGQAKVTRAIADGECVHCLLASTKHINRRGAVAIPKTWIAVPPTMQMSLFNAPSKEAEPGTYSLADLSGSHRDHILHRQLHDVIAPDLSSEQAVFVRRHWIVPSCPRHNLERAFSLESLPYLLHVFALYLAAKQLTIGDSVAETHLFVDAVKSAHVALRLQAAAGRMPDVSARPETG